MLPCIYFCAALALASALTDPTIDASGSSINIGVAVSGEDTMAAILTGITLAAAEINAHGGINGRLIGIIPAPPKTAWQQAGAALVKQIIAHQIVALIAPMEGATAHLIAQIATKMRIPVIHLSPEESINQAGSPWVLRGVPTDRQQLHAVLQLAIQQLAVNKVYVVVPAGREGRERLAIIKTVCHQLQVAIVEIVTQPPINPNNPAVNQSHATLLWLDRDEADVWLARQKATSLELPILTSIRFGNHQISNNSSDWVAHIVIPYVQNLHFASNDASRHCKPILANKRAYAAPITAFAYDALWRIALALKDVSPTPANIRNQFRRGCAVSQYSGIYKFDKTGNAIHSLIGKYVEHAVTPQ